MVTPSELDFFVKFNELAYKYRGNLWNFVTSKLSVATCDADGVIKVFTRNIALEDTDKLAIKWQLVTQFSTLGPIIFIHGLPIDTGEYNLNGSSLSGTLYRWLVEACDSLGVSLMFIVVDEHDACLRHNVLEDNDAKLVETITDEWLGKRKYVYSKDMGPDYVHLEPEEVFDPAMAEYPLKESAPIQEQEPPCGCPTCVAANSGDCLVGVVPQELGETKDGKEDEDGDNEDLEE